MSPFSGPPPSNLTHVIARAVVSANSASRVGRRKKLGTLDTAPAVWRHGLKSTRLMILALVKERDGNTDTPKQFDPEITPKRRSVRIVRQGSMDFLPVTRNVSTAARLGSRLQGPPPVTNQTAHPYSRMQRTASLSCIPGSPTQPKKNDHPSTSTSIKMSRVSSDGQGMLNPMRFRAIDSESGAHERLETLSGSPSTGGYASGSSNNSLLSSWSGNVVPSSSSLSSAFTSTPPKARGAGLASAFHSPLLGPTAPVGLHYPTPISVRKTRMVTDSGPKSAGPLEGSFQEQLERGLARADRLEVPGSAREATFGSRLEVPSAKGGFYFGGAREEEDSMSPYDSDASLASSRSTSPYPAMSMSNSPMSSSFDLNDLSLDALAKEKMASNGAGFFDAWAAGWSAPQQ